MDEPKYRRLYEHITRVIWDEIAPLEQQIETEEAMPYDRLFPILRESGAFGLLIPQSYGGAGLTIKQYLPIIAEFAKVHGGVRALVHVHNSFAHALSEVGSESQCKEILPAAAIGENSIAFALTEPSHGTGVDLGTVAVRQDDHYIINGTKWLITNSDIASHFIVFAKTDDAQVSAFLVERLLPGLKIEKLPETMGCKGGEHGVLTFSDVRVSRADLIGSEGEGQDHLERALEISRVFIAASSLGTAQRAFDLSVEYARNRVTFGKPIAERQAVQRYLAEMATDIYALRHMLLDAARRWDNGDRIPAEASMCKLFGLEAVGRVTDRALLVHGGIGFTRRHSIERLYRDARLNWLEEGPPTIQYLVAARRIVDGHSWDDEFEPLRSAAGVVKV